MTSKEKKLCLENSLLKTCGEDFFKVGNGKFNETLYKKGEVILGGETFERCLIFILRGSAAVYKIGALGKKTAVNILSAGDIFGMATLFYEADYPSDVVAESACKALVFPKDTVLSLISESSEFCGEYISLLSRKIHFLNEKLGTFTENDTAERLRGYLQGMSAGKNEFLLNISVSRLAESLGVGRASVYRAFDSLAEEGILIRDGKKIVILNSEKFQK